jgi:predicted nucleic acid-binding protein
MNPLLVKWPSYGYIRKHEHIQRRRAQIAFTNLDLWLARSAQQVETSPVDMRLAAAFIRRLDLTLRTPDAVNLAIARRTDAELATFDVKMAANARVLGLSVVDA